MGMGDVVGIRDPFSVEGAADIFQQNFLGPALQGFTQNTVPAINQQFAGIGGTLSSRRSKTIADAGATVQAQAQQQFGQFLPQIMGLQLQPFSQANQFLGINTFENIVTQQSSMFDNIMGGIGGVAGAFSGIGSIGSSVAGMGSKLGGNSHALGVL